MAKIEGIRALRNQLNRLAADAAKKHDGSVMVGYTAEYALYVHENTKARHNKGQQAKYLEQPAREERREIAGVMRKAVQGGADLIQGLYLAGLRLLRESKALVPVDTGNLKNSGFVRKDAEKA